MAEYRRAIALDPKKAKAHNNLGNALQAKGDLDGAIAAYRKAIALDPNDAERRYNLGNALLAKGDLDGAIGTYRRAIALDPKHAKAHSNLGCALYAKGDRGAAIVELRRAIALNPKHAGAHNNLGNALKAKGDVDGAIAEYRRAIAIEPKLVHAHGALGKALLQQGRFAEGCQATRNALELLRPNDPLRKMVSQQLQRGEQLLHLNAKLTAVFEGEGEPASATEQLGLGFLCQQYKKRYMAAVRFYADAFAADSGLARDLRNQNRYKAACAAVLAAAGQGVDAAKLPDKLQARLRQQALGWLQEDLAAWKKVRGQGTAQARAAVQKMLQHWQKDPDLISLRDKKSLAKLPEAEQHAWQTLWADVDAVLASARPK
jgi:tetratricopeptide (TPR) repeat protein